MAAALLNIPGARMNPAAPPGAWDGVCSTGCAGVQPDPCRTHLSPP